MPEVAPLDESRSPAYKRVMVKLSGQAMAGAEGFGLDASALEHIASEILAVRDAGVQVSIMVGGGNIFRGNLAQRWGIERVEADNIGMVATVINALMLRGALKARSDYEVRVMTALPMEAIAEPYIRLRAAAHLQRGYIVVLGCGIGQPLVTTDYPAVQRAIELSADAILVGKNGVDGVYSADPAKDPTAKRFESIPYDAAIDEGLGVMDLSAFILARDAGIPLHVFDIEGVGAMRRICEGNHVGTMIGPGVQTVLA
jgi:uridylate kinase